MERHRGLRLVALHWEKYFNKFGTLFSKDLSSDMPDPTTLTGAGIGKADAVGNSEYLEGGSTFSHAVQISPLNDFIEIGEHTDRRARYLEYDRLENVPEIHNSLDTYSDEITTPDIEGKVFDIITTSSEIKEELEWFFHDQLSIQQDLWAFARNLCKNGDLFLECIIDPDNPQLGIQRVVELPPETMYRIETVRGRTLEFQQSYMGPDYQCVVNDINQKYSQAQSYINSGDTMYAGSPVTTSGTMAGPMVSNQFYRAIRFQEKQVIHLRIGTKRRGFYPYGVSILYAGRRIAHLLKLMEDAMVIYRLTRATDRRVFYIDVGHLPPHKGEQVLERMKDKIKKKKVFNNRTGIIDERFNPWAQDEDFFIATRPEANTRIETLPGAQNTDQIDDTKYFREKLMVALKLPKNYLFQEDTNVTRTSYASQDMRFARAIYRIQMIMSEGLKDLAKRHLLLRGFPEEDVRKLKIKFTQPSDWMELSRSEIINNRYNLASSIKGAQLYDDYTILTKTLKHTHDEAVDIINKLEIQLLRQQEIQAQAAVYAQLATAQQSSEIPGGMDSMRTSSPEFNQPGTSPMEAPTQSMETPQETPKPLTFKEYIPKEEKKSRYDDIEDLEADEEETDETY